MAEGDKAVLESDECQEGVHDNATASHHDEIEEPSVVGQWSYLESLGALVR